MGAAAAAVAIASPAQAQTRTFDIPAQPAARGIPAFARAAGIPILARGEIVRGKRTRAVRGTYTVEEGLRRLLEGTGLAVRGGVNPSDITVIGLAADASPARSNTPETGSVPQAGTPDPRSAIESAGVAEILVVGSRSQNTDVVRTRDDPQPYVVITAEQIRSSNATTIDQLLRTRLPQNAQNSSHDQRGGFGFDRANAGQINLRGLGTNQTLVLVDGRRLPGVSEAGDLQQSTIAGIPLAAIERIEVLPSTAGAIYGGSAVGGVVNIILKRDYSGLTAEVVYGNTFDWATGDISASLNGGMTLGPLSIMATASLVRTGQLFGADRDRLVRRSQELVDLNNPQPGFVPRLGAFPNFCSTTSTFQCDGAPLVLRDGRALNSTFGSVPEGYAGPGSDGGTALLDTAGAYSRGTPPGPNALIQRSQTESLGLNLRLPILDATTSYVDINWNHTHANNRDTAAIFGLLPASDPNNPFQQSILVNYSTPALYGTGTNSIRNLRINGGLIVRLPHRWSMSLEQNWGRTRAASTGNSDAVPRNQSLTPLLQLALRDATEFPPDFPPNTRPGFINGPSTAQLIDSTARLSGPLFALAGGPIVLTTLAERRQNRIGETINRSDTGSPGDSVTIIPRQRQTIYSLYAEARVPLFSSLNARPLLQALELQGSVRYDRYATTGTSDQFRGPTLEAARQAAAAVTYSTNRVESVDFLAAIRYAPVRDIAIRASYSTGFLAPSNAQVNSTLSSLPGSFLGFFGRFDPKRGNGGFPGDANRRVTFINGGNPALQPEESRSTSVGVIFTPRFVPGLRLSVDYTHIAKSNEIFALDEQQILLNEDLLPGRVVRRDRLPGDPAGFAGPVVSIDRTLLNIFRSRISALDFQADYDVSTRHHGDFHFYLVASHALRLKRQIDPELDLVDTVDFSDGPLRWRGNVGLDWTLGNLRLNWNMQYYASYNGYASVPDPSFRDVFVLNQGRARIPSQTYHDVAASYIFPETSRLSGFELGIGVQNLFNRLPPAINSNNGLYSTYGDPRLRRFTLRLRKQF